MAKDPLDKVEDDLDDPMEDLLDESMSDILEGDMDEDFDDSMDEVLEDDMGDVLEDFTPEGGKEEKSSALPKISEKIKSLFKKILGSKKLIIISIVSLVCIVVIGISFMVFLFIGTDKPPGNSGVPVQSGSNNTSVTVVEEIAFEDIVELEPFERIPLKTSSSLGLISVNLALEIVKKEERGQIYLVEERIRQIVMDQMAKTTWLELRNPEGKIMLKYSLLKQINSLFPRPMVRNVYFTYFVMQ